MTTDFAETEFLSYLKGKELKNDPRKLTTMKDPYIINPPETSRQTKASGKKRTGRDSKKLSVSKSKLKRVSTSKKKSATVAERPKRAVIPKNLDGATGLSWQEENELKRALYASLQECRRLSRQSSPELPEVSPPGPPDKQSGKKLSKKKVQPTTRLPRKDKALPKNLLSKPTTNEIKTKSTSTENQSFERLKQETKSLFKAKMHAQRKFAQNTVPFTSSPSITPVKMRASPSEKKEILHGKKAKTEDFLTFLCLRGTDVLPPRLDFFSYADTVTPSPSKSGGSRSSTPLSKVGLWKKGSAPRNTANSDSNLGVKPLKRHAKAVHFREDPKFFPFNPSSPIVKLNRLTVDSATSVSSENSGDGKAVEDGDVQLHEYDHCYNTRKTFLHDKRLAFYRNAGGVCRQPSASVSCPDCYHHAVGQCDSCRLKYSHGCLLNKAGFKRNGKQDEYHCQDVDKILQVGEEPSFKQQRKDNGSSATSHCDGDHILDLDVELSSNQELINKDLGSGDKLDLTDKVKECCMILDALNVSGAKLEDISCVDQPKTDKELNCTSPQVLPLDNELFVNQEPTCIGSGNEPNVASSFDEGMVLHSDKELSSSLNQKLSNIGSGDNVALTEPVVKECTVLLDRLNVCNSRMADILQSEHQDNVTSISQQQHSSNKKICLSLNYHQNSNIKQANAMTSQALTTQAQAYSHQTLIDSKPHAYQAASVTQANGKTVINYSPIQTQFHFTAAETSGINAMQRFNAPSDCETEVLHCTEVGQTPQRESSPSNLNATEPESTAQALETSPNEVFSTVTSVHERDSSKGSPEFPKSTNMEFSTKLNTAVPTSTNSVHQMSLSTCIPSVWHLKKACVRLLPLPPVIPAPGVFSMPKDSPAKVRKDKKQKKMVSSLKGEPKASRGRRLPPPLIPAIPLKSQNETDRTKDKIKHLRAKQLTKKAKTIKTSSLSSSVNKSRSRLKRKLDTEQEFDSTPQLPEKKGKIDRKLSEKTKRKNLKNVSKYSLHENGSDHSEVNLAEVQDPTDDGIKSDAEQVAARPRLRSKLKRLESEDSEISFKNQVGDGERTAIEDEKQEILELDETRGKPKGKPTKKKRAVERNSLAVAKKTKLCAEIEPPAKKPARSKVKNSDPTSSATCGLGGENVQSSCIPLPTFHPTIDEFHDPLVYMEGIREQAEQFGMCKIVPPSGWKPECRIQEEMRFTSQLQYVHKMQDRWGPSVLELECIRRHLQSQGIKLDHPPVVAGIELDLAKCNKIIQEFGGMQKVIDKKKWVKVADALGLPVVAHDRSAKLYSAYCKYLLSYATLPAEEVAKIREQVISEHAKKKDFSDDNCVAKGRSMTPANFFRAAEMTQAAWMKDQITPEKVEEEYWKYVNNKDCHVTVQCGHVDTNACGSAFPSKGTHSKHGWNYNVLSQHKNCVLRHLGPVMGVSSPTLHLGMLFSTSCWSTDPHRLPYIQYLHTGAPVIWYCIPREEVSKFKSAMFEMVPNILSKNQVWLPEDTAMVSPSLLASKGVTVGRTLQKEGEFMVVFSEAFTGTVSCGYNINESLHIATAEWLPLGNEAANMLHASCEPELFSMDKLLWRLAKNETTPVDTLKIVFPLLEQSIKRELNQRLQLIAAGLKQFEQMKVEDEGHLPNTRRKRSSLSPDQDEHVCDVNKKICFFSMVVSEANERETFYSLESALVHISKKQLKTCKLMYRYDEKELHKILDNVKVRLTATDSPRKRNKIK